MIILFIVIIIFIIILFYIINRYIHKYSNIYIDKFMNNIEYFCYGNVYCNGNKINSLCINQNCSECGVTSSKCNSDSECGPNLCINGCCDTM